MIDRKVTAELRGRFADLPMIGRKVTAELRGRFADLPMIESSNLSAEGQTNHEKATKIHNPLADMSKIMPESYIVLTAKENMDIVQAANVWMGAWHHCPDDHIYAIGECIQAKEESSCPECHARIGGTNHRLLDDNAQAPERNGAKRPVWDNLGADRELAVKDVEYIVLL
ncbi:nfx1-type Zinc finger-containing protein 1-like [Plakobranchus ocellatus]|uniref:Nfx1-type Zinc finger-containing protein 1-like n=1 Tax=Plakobranchus ocellatus TaxID=259542 RepID=A0AAV4AAU7_9GAST|nr:nfx1-type Zinc finger-containing protein 1-like [Plakobranchus ocellatus]